jgi:hypothetical protein
MMPARSRRTWSGGQPGVNGRDGRAERQSGPEVRGSSGAGRIVRQPDVVAQLVGQHGGLRAVRKIQRRRLARQWTRYSIGRLSLGTTLRKTSMPGGAPPPTC